MDKHLEFGHSCEVCKPLRPANPSLFGLGPMLGRRDFFRIAGTGVTGFFVVPLLSENTLAARTADYSAQLKGTARNCIFIHLQGAASHVDTFDFKPGSWTPADFAPETINGILFPKGLMPNTAQHLDKIAIVRSMRAPALVHSLQQVWSQISRNPSAALGKIAPNIGAVAALEFEAQRQSHHRLPGFVTLNGGNVVSSGYFNARYSPFAVTAAANGLSNLNNPDGQTTFETRYQMLKDIDGDLRTSALLGEDVSDMEGFYQQSRAMMYNPEVDAVFRFTSEDQQRYGNSGFGNSCIVARNLVRSDLGTRFIQINIGGWDNHQAIFTPGQGIYRPIAQFDPGFANLLKDLSEQPGTKGGSLLDETLVVVMGEFGRTVRSGSTVGLNAAQGRDHYFVHFTVFAGGGVGGGRTIGSTTAEGLNTLDPGWSQGRPATYEDVSATIYSALGIDYTTKRYDDPFGRGFEYVPFAADGAWYPILELFSRDLDDSRLRLEPRGGGRKIT